MLMGTIALRCKKCDFGGNIRMVASGKPVDTAENDLIYLFLAGKIRVNRINSRDKVDWLTIATKSHNRDLVYCVDREAMGGKFCEY